jgi:hypothetical protein
VKPPMALPWQNMDLVPVSSYGRGFWTLACEFVPGSRLLHLRTVNENRDGQRVPILWSPAGDNPCGPDGDPSAIARTGMLCSSAAYGALIGKIGGSTADTPDTAAGSSGPYPGKKVFAVGVECILSLPTAADGGPLFLTMNDKPESFPCHVGDLHVLIQYYPL